MKKSLTLAAVIFMLTACMKEKTCTCTDPNTGETKTTGSRKSNNRASLKEFEDDCKSKKYKVTNGYGAYSYGCEVK